MGKTATTKTKKVKFTLASDRDSFPTVTASRIGVNAIKLGLEGKTVFLKLKSKYSASSNQTYTVKLRLNRLRSANNATFIAENWPKQLRKPSVGDPIEFVLVGLKEAK